MQERHIVPELEVFKGGMLSNTPKLMEEQVLTPPFHVNFCLGFDGPLPAAPTSLFFLKLMVPQETLWGVIHNSMENFALLATAIGLGATMVRVGFEDSVYFAPGETAKTNTELVENIVALIHYMGCEVATPQEAMEYLHIHP